MLPSSFVESSLIETEFPCFHTLTLLFLVIYFSIVTHDFRFTLARLQRFGEFVLIPESLGFYYLPFFFILDFSSSLCIYGSIHFRESGAVAMQNVLHFGL